MDCIALVELVTAYLEDALDHGERRRFEEHLTGCDGCRRYVEQMRVVVDQLGALPPEQLSGTTRDRLLRAFADWDEERRAT